MKISKILAADATPAKVILDRAFHVALTSKERNDLPTRIMVNGTSVETDVAEKRALEVGDVLLDDAGHFYVIDPAPETLLMIKGEEEFVAEAAVALLNRGIRVAQVEHGFAIAKDEELLKMLSDAGLEFEEIVMPFDPIKLPRRHHGGCCCGHHHEHGESCSCGADHHHHHHHHDEGECCCKDHHAHEHSEGCACGGEHHHHHHDEGECCCKDHHAHEHSEGCACGGEHHHHHHEEGGCCCGDGHHHKDSQCDCQKDEIK